MNVILPSQTNHSSHKKNGMLQLTEVSSAECKCAGKTNPANHMANRMRCLSMQRQPCHLELDSGASGQACASVARLQGQQVKPVPLWLFLAFAPLWSYTYPYSSCKTIQCSQNIRKKGNGLYVCLYTRSFQMTLSEFTS